MRNTSWLRLLATGAVAASAMASLSLPTAAGVAAAVPVQTVQTECSTLRSVVNGQVIEMPACRILTAAP